MVVMKMWLLLGLFCWAALCSTGCIKYLAKLQQMSKLAPQKFKQQMTPYLVLSGKGIDDLGFPQSCQNDQRGYSYNTVQLLVASSDNINQQFSGYLGFCFTQNCSTADLNGFAGFIMNYIFQEYETEVKSKFVDPPLALDFSPLALVMSVFFLVCVGISMTAPIMIWMGMCKRSEDEEFIIKSVYIDLQNPNEEYDEQTIHETSTLIERMSLKYKWKELWKSEQTQKVYSFSLFRVGALPLVVYGQVFWLSNRGAYNYYAFWEELYDQFFVKFAVFAYYLPDIFFFISAFIFTQKLLAIEGDYFPAIFKNLGSRVARLYPIYFMVLLIYWCITPSLHMGPVWYKYQEEVAVCNHSWWRVLLLIDNWFENSCYPSLWFVQAQVQFAIVICLYFCIYFSCRKASYYILGLAYIGSFLLMALLSADMPVSFDVALIKYTQIYFRSFYSHLTFSLTGVVFGILANKESIRFKVQELVLQKQILHWTLKLTALGISILILLRPWVWLGTWSSPFELALCRKGIMLCFCIFFLEGMFKRETHRSVLHKYGYYLYPAYLVVWMVVSCNFWSGSSFPYISGESVLNLSITNFLIGGILGIFLGLLFDLRTLTVK